MPDANFARSDYFTGDVDKGFADFTEAIRLNPKNFIAYLNRGFAYFKKDDYDKAIADYSEAIRLDPRASDVYLARGFAYRAKGERDKAIADFTETILLKPDYVLAYNSRGTAYRIKGEYDKAITDYTEAIRLKPDDADNYNALARLLATCPDEKYRNGKEAVLNAKKACELDGETNWRHLGTLAAAYAESGDFENACELQEKVIAMADDKSKKEYRSRMELYKQDKPYHEELNKM